MYIIQHVSMAATLLLLRLSVDNIIIVSQHSIQCCVLKT